MILFIILCILWVIITYTHPWIDSYIDFRGQKHVVFWFTNHKGERKYINIIGSQES